MKPRVGVSACLLGQPVRYDGDSRPHDWICRVLSLHAELVPICPETEAGLGVPRPPVQLVRLSSDEVIMRGVNDPGLDVTEQLLRWLGEQEERLAGLQALVLKSRSPSCGLGSTPLFSVDGEMLREDGDGLLAAWIRKRSESLHLYDEKDLEQPHRRTELLSRLRQ
ncbi:DUF523 domain-containing protein [Thiolapillus sp.]